MHKFFNPDASAHFLLSSSKITTIYFANYQQSFGADVELENAVVKHPVNKNQMALPVGVYADLLETYCLSGSKNQLILDVTPGAFHGLIAAYGLGMPYICFKSAPVTNDIHLDYLCDLFTDAHWTTAKNAPAKIKWDLMQSKSSMVSCFSSN